jgi:[acyl-carrier-protein] S-malonyltransferase
LLAIVAPGQGSQFVGMLNDWLKDKECLDTVTKFSKLVKNDLAKISLNYTEDQIRNTNISQPLIVTTSFLAFQKLCLTESEVKKIIFAGHSVGEFVAASLAGVFDVGTAIKLVGERGNLMEKSSSENYITGMSAVLGGDKSRIISYLNDHGLTPANVNCDGQIIAAGSIDKLNELRLSPPEGTRIRPLEVSGAFHTNYMKSARDNFAEIIKEIIPNLPTSILISNKDGEIISNKLEIISRLTSQITSPVRWDLCQAKFVELGVTGLLELAPGGTLTGIAKREIPSIETFALKSPNDIDSATEFIRKHVG